MELWMEPLKWYLFFTLMGWLSFPFFQVCFRHYLRDEGFFLSKILAWVILAYGVWLGVSVDLFSYGTVTVRMTTLGLALLFFITAVIRRKYWYSFLKEKWRILISGEILFASAFFLFCAVQLFKSSIQSAEKPADYTLFHGILQSIHFPPQDLWYGGEAINYYYGGFYLTGFPALLLGTIPEVAFNLAVVSIFSLVWIMSFSLLVNATGRIRYGLLAALLVAGISNLDGFWQIIERGSFLPYDWWRSSRVIPNTINEFPFFSFLLGDLHAHYMALPFEIAVLILLYAAFKKGIFFSLGGEVIKKGVRVLFFFFLTLLLGLLPWINFWDFPTFGILALFVVVLSRLIRGKGMRSVWKGLLVEFPFLFVGGFLLFYFFYKDFHPPAASWEGVPQVLRSPFQSFFLLHGLFLFLLLPLFWIGKRDKSGSDKGLILKRSAAILTFLLVYVFLKSMVIALSCLFLGTILFHFFQKRWGGEENFWLVLLLVTFLIWFGCEWVFVRDFYGHPLERQNTIFKFYYHSWLFVALSSVFFFSKAKDRFLESPLKWKFYRIGFLFLLGASLIYPFLGTFERCGRFLIYSSRLARPLVGTAFIEEEHARDVKPIEWIRENLERGAMILEATGDPYSFYGRVSTFSGRPTLLGWANHEALWRDPSWKSIMNRKRDVETIYNEPRKEKVDSLLKKYQIDYVYVGSLERKQYSAEGLSGFSKNFPLVYQDRHTEIYRVIQRAPEE